jgi:NAD(P)-dependent dehydrogenase (short-subunit alcohol dehydrogenase family)
MAAKPRQEGQHEMSEATEANDNRSAGARSSAGDRLLANRRVALITGASRGLGAELARFLAARGYDLLLTARGEQALWSTAGELERLGGGRVVAEPGDVADPGHRERLAQAAADLGRLDLLVNNASGLGVVPLPPLASYPLDELQQLFSVNVLAPLGLVQRLLPLLEASGGLVVNVSSDAALGGYPGWGGYGATKAALDLISLTLSNEVAARDVAVVSVDPGDLRTRMQQDAFPGEDISDRPEPAVTLPFWAWLLGQPRAAVNGRRFRAQAEVWEVAV